MRRISRIFLALAVVLASAAGAQTLDLQQALSGKDFPHTLKLKELTADWRHVSITTSEKSTESGDAMKQLMQLGTLGQAGKEGGGKDAAGAMAAMSMLGGLFGGGGGSAPSYYTMGKTTSIAGEPFLVVYKLEAKGLNFMDLVAQSAKEGG